ncbi:MAG: hypothetical protein OEV00_06410 [Acidobacteriota bacterium]|nr:hypothetical protein [Acidobacteriota bacterium]MDH3784943.1 hypothetical protein [Acidobacteriota bacterium]
MSLPTTHSDTDPPSFENRTIGDVQVLDRLGEGGRSGVYNAIWNGQQVALKIYKLSALERHARKHPVRLEEFEYSRNLAFYEAPGMARYVARPYGTLVVDDVRGFMQERLDGELYYFYYRRHEGKLPPSLFEHVRQMVKLFHEAELYDVDLHSMNVMVVEDSDGQPIPKLFDFNLIPFNVRPPNPLLGVLLKLGLMSPRARDLRKLKNFHNFERVERKLLKFYE